MGTIPEALSAAIEYHQVGRLVEAEEIYRQILATDPDQPDAWHLLGVMAHQAGRHEAAIEHIGRAIRLKTSEPAYHNNLGEVYRALQRIPEAIASYRRALELAPDLADAHNNLGLALKAQGQTAEAIDCYQRALQLRGDYAEAHNNLGLALQDQGQAAESIVCYQRALAFKPSFVLAHNNLGTALHSQGQVAEAVACYRRALELVPDLADAHNNLGFALQEEGQSAEAAVCCRRALELKPDFAQAYNNLGRALQDQGQIAEAIECYQRAAQLKPDFVMVHNNLGTVFHEQGRLADATACYRRALDLSPGLNEAHTNLGLALQDQGQFTGATGCYQQALAQKPDNAMAHLNLSLLWLATGDFEKGWPEYEWRWKTKQGYSPRSLPEPLWDGGSLDGKTILLHAEQGLGDTIQFVRYAPLLKQRGATVILECQKPLLRLLSGCSGVDHLVGQGDGPPPFDVHCPLLSVPRVLQTTLETIPADVPYLFAAPPLVKQWQDRLRDVAGFRVGINWQGNPRHTRDRMRSVRLEHFAAVGQVPGVRLISLQKGPGAEQWKEAANSFGIMDLGESFDKAAGPFMDTAAVMMNLDLVISSDTSIAHLAGALGVPVWVALPFAPDWRWLLDREDSPWYPTMRLFRQKRPGEWTDVFEEIRRALCVLLQSSGDRAQPIVANTDKQHGHSADGDG